MVYLTCKECGHSEQKWTPEPTTWHQETYVVRCPECGKKELMVRSKDKSRWEYAVPDVKKREKAAEMRNSSSNRKKKE